MFRCGSPGSSRPWRGFPIRTPWDHSPVIDSPRLIADSYVLLRLLMPRHPPCALKNLTTKDQGVIFERTTETTTITPKGNSDRSRFIFLEIASYKRCSRPLCSSQTTTPYHTPHTRPAPKDRNNRMIGAARKPETQVPHHNHAPSQRKSNAAAPWSCCLRTQQCAKHYPAVHSGERSRTPSREHPYLLPACAARHLFADIPPVSTRRRTIVCATGVLLTTPPHPHTRGKVTVGAP